jgi:O-succinylbenzoic acid--CoA ligase
MKYNLLTDNKGTISGFKRFSDVWSNESKIIEQQSSGSTGTPKLIEISKIKMKSSAEMTGAFFQLGSLKNSLLCISTDYIGGKMMFVRSVLYDLEINVVDVISNPIRNLNEQIDFAAMVPLQVETILQENPEKLDLIKYLIIGGAPVSLNLEKKLQERMCIAYSTYGMTETISHVALKKLDSQNTPFKAIGETYFNECDGELIIHSPQLGIEGLHTNDIVELIDKHQFHWLGRKDFVINSGGVKIHPEVLEHQIRNKIKVDEFIISSLSDVTLGEKVIIICEDNAVEEFKQLIENWCFNRYEKPREVYTLDSLPQTKNGKIDRLAAKDRIIHD